jgi:hypothetical protein
MRSICVPSVGGVGLPVPPLLLPLLDPLLEPELDPLPEPLPEPLPLLEPLLLPVWSFDASGPPVAPPPLLLLHA